MHENILQWAIKTPLKQKGVITGCSKNHEWMLPWWWMNYSLHNEYPVTFLDFGDMSPVAKQWCQRKGQLVTLQIPTEDFVANRGEVPREHGAVWETHLNLDTWLARLSWFKKPFACLQSPYERTIWIDLDCQARQSITPIFKSCENALEMAMAEEPPLVLEDHRNRKLLLLDEMEYNSGVIVFNHGAALIQDWARRCIELNNVLRGDQEVFSRMIYERKIAFSPMHPSFNWRAHLQPSFTPLIIHYLGNCKQFILQQMILFSKSASMDFSLM